MSGLLLVDGKSVHPREAQRPAEQQPEVVTVNAPAQSTQIPRTRLRPGRRRTAVFVREFLHDPLTTASVVPSSAALAAAMIPAGRNWPVVLELGPGTGAFSRALRAQQQPPVRHLGLEVNPTMSALLSADFPDMQVITRAAAELTAVLASEQLLGRVDLVVSGLPWQAFAGPVGAGLIPAIAGALHPDGAFTQFTYSWTRWTPPGRRQHRNLRANFGRVQVQGPVWANVPPATVYTCREPRQVPAEA